MSDETPDGGDLLLTPWAKSWPMDTTPTSWLPVWQHMDDSADVAALLWDQWMAPRTRELISDVFPDGHDDGRRFVRWIAGVHDVGKVSPPFASKVAVLGDRMRRTGFHFPYAGKVQGARHEDVSAFALGRWLREHDVSSRRAGQYTCLVGAHHGLFKADPCFLEGDPDIGEQPWATARAALLDRVARRTGTDKRLGDWRDLRLPSAVQMVTSALVIMADWIASSDIFPLFELDHVPVPPQADEHLTARAVLALKNVDLGGLWQPATSADPGHLISERFPSIDTPRAIQKALVGAAGDPDAVGMLILEAPMGVGKTEAALAAAEVMSNRYGCRGVFVALPTRATSDAMFSRVHEWLSHMPTTSADGTLSLSLVHGKAAFNEEYRDLRFGSVDHSAVYDGERCAGVGVAEWMSGKKRATLSSFVVGTIDHVLFASLKAKHVALRQLSLAGKVVILDEVHAADAYMSVYLERALSWMGAMGVPVIVMTATLPGSTRRRLLEAYHVGVSRRTGVTSPRKVELPDDIGYPAVVTATRGEALVVNPPHDAPPRTVRLHALDDSPAALVQLLRNRLDEGGCAVVVCNTVRRAQETAATLEGTFGSNSVTLTHSRFLAIDRARNDRSLLRRFGPPGSGVDRPSRHIVVATQVVEQSLDLDFDLMVTDIAPVDLVLQRIGRLHRHQRGIDQQNRPERVRQAECHLRGVDWQSPVPTPDAGSVAVYRLYRLLASLSVLTPYLRGETLRLPDDIAALVQQAYSDGLEPPTGWTSPWMSAKAKEEDHSRHQEEAARAFCLGAVMSDGTSLHGLTVANAGNVDEESHLVRASVRDGVDSLEVVVVQRVEGCDFVPEWVECEDPMLPIRDVPPTWEQTRLLAQCTVSLPRELSTDASLNELEQTCFLGWQRSPFLAGQLTLVLDENRQANLADRTITYDVARGLLVSKAAGAQA